MSMKEKRISKKILSMKRQAAIGSVNTKAVQ